jgi:hypothetical protein
MGNNAVAAMNSEARHHHYISQFYLKGFAERREKKQKPVFTTHVTDFRLLKAFNCNVRDVGGERDFNRVDIPGHSPTAIEESLSAFESTCAAALKRVVISKKFEGKDANLVLNFMALLAVRSPERRDILADFHDRVHRGLLASITSNEATWQATIAGMQADGIVVNPSISYEDARSFSQRGEFDVFVPREYHLRVEFDLVNSVLPLLGRRRWTLYTADGSSGEFITTDRPVTLMWTEKPRANGIFSSPGFGLKNTEVLFPLSRKAALIGRWDRGGGTEVAQRDFVATFNTQMLHHSLDRAFSAIRKIVYRDPIARVIEDDKLLENYKQWSGRTEGPAAG